MTTTTIDPSAIGHEHLGRVLELSWPVATWGGVHLRSRLRGVLTAVSHGRHGTSLTMDLGYVDVPVSPTELKAADVELTNE